MSVPCAGQLAFDNIVSRYIVAVLAGGPLRLSDMSADGIAAQDLLANLIVLCCSGAVRPVEPSDVSVATLNRAIESRVNGLERTEYVALSCGTAVRVEPALLRARRDGEQAADAMGTRWLDFLAVNAR